MAVKIDYKDTWKIGVLAASTTDVPVNSVLPVIDTVNTTYGDRILLKDQTDPLENGIYVVQAFTLVKDTDNNVASSFVNGAVVRVLGGSANINTEFYIAPITAANYLTTPKVFVTSPFSGGGGGGGINGSIANTQVAFGSGVNIISGSSSMTYTSPLLQVNGNYIGTELGYNGLWLGNVPNGSLTNYTLVNNAGTTQLSGTAAAPVSIMRNNTALATFKVPAVNTPALDFLNALSNNVITFYSGFGIGLQAGKLLLTASPAGKISIGNYDGISSYTENFVVDNSTSNVGIGIATPTEKLDVAGRFKFTGTAVTEATSNKFEYTVPQGSAPSWFSGVYVKTVNQEPTAYVKGFWSDVTGPQANAGHFSNNTTGINVGIANYNGWSIETNGPMFLNNANIVIQYGGKIGVGTWSPNASLDIYGVTADASTYAVRVQDSATNLNFYVQNDGTVSSRLGYWIGAYKVLHEGGHITSIYGGVNAGYNASASMTYNTVFGFQALFSAATVGNTAIGAYAATNFTGQTIVAVGYAAANNNISGNAMTAIGQGALYKTTADENTALGYQAGYEITTGVGNTFIGARSGSTGPGQTNKNFSIAIGYYTYTTADNQCVIGNQQGFAHISEFVLGYGPDQPSFCIGDTMIRPTNVRAGVTDINSDYNIIFAGSRGTGTGHGGDIIFKTAKAGLTGSTQNPLAEAFRIKQNKYIQYIGDANFGTGKILVSDAAGVLNYSSVNALAAKDHGSFLNTLTQTTTANTPTAVTYNTTDISNGITVVSGSQITVSTTATYNVQFSAQLNRTSGGTAQHIHIWIRKNGVDIANSNSKIVVNSNSQYAVAAWNWFVPLTAGDNVELMWAPTEATIELYAETADLVLPAPAVPSIIVTVSQL